MAARITPEARERIRRNLIEAGYFADPEESKKKPAEAESSSMTPSAGRVATAKAV